MANPAVCEVDGVAHVLSGVPEGTSVQTELGRLTLPGSVHVALRPEQLRLVSDRDLNAEVVDRDFRGPVLYRPRYESGLTLLQLSSLELHEVGTRVFVGLVASAVAPVVD